MWVRDQNGLGTPLAASHQPYFNVTDSLAHPEAHELLRVKQLTEDEAHGVESVLLMTDGISEDLIDPGAFCKDVVETLSKEPEIVWEKVIGDWLRRWPTPGHSDDKTLLVVTTSDQVEASGGGLEDSLHSRSRARHLITSPLPSSATQTLDVSVHITHPTAPADGWSSFVNGASEALALVRRLVSSTRRRRRP